MAQRMIESTDTLLHGRNISRAGADLPQLAGFSGMLPVSVLPHSS